MTYDSQAEFLAAEGPSRGIKTLVEREHCGD